jgi:hypothetical protein
MTKPIQNLIAIAAFLVSIFLNLFVMERAGSFANYFLLYGFDGRFTLNAKLTAFALCCGLAGLIFSVIAQKKMSIMANMGRHMLIVSVYMNAISVFMVALMALFPTVHLVG